MVFYKTETIKLKKLHGYFTSDFKMARVKIETYWFFVIPIYTRQTIHSLLDS